MERAKIGKSFRAIARALRHPKPIPVFVVSLDALNTLYRFREPVATQYLTVAQECGLRSPVDTGQLERAFKSSFKQMNREFPNYGKGKLPDPRSWWMELVDHTFRDVVKDASLPPELGERMYEHFSSSAAYTLFPDVHRFLDTIRRLKDQYADPDGPLVLTGIITNSDPRVRLVLQSLGISTGLSTFSPATDLRESLSQTWASRTPQDLNDVWENRNRRIFGAKNDIDFLCTSYDAESEKPDARIWESPQKVISLMPASRAELAFAASAPDTIGAGIGHRVGKLSWLHIGDDYSKDYLGATRAGLEALHLSRDPDSESSPAAENTNTVSNLDEAAMVVSLIAQEFFQEADTEGGT